MGVPQVDEHVWPVSFMHYDLGILTMKVLSARTDRESVRADLVTHVSGMIVTYAPDFRSHSPALYR